MNPISKTINIAIPPLSAPLVDPTSGNINLAWYNALFGLFLRTGGQAGVNTDDIKTTASNALNQANTANQRAILANNLASEVQSELASVSSLANAALNVANNNTISNALIKNNNLSDLPSVGTARSNLGVGLAGSTAQRPTARYVGEMYLDLTLNIPIWWNGANWINSTGGSV